MVNVIKHNRWRRVRRVILVYLAIGFSLSFIVNLLGLFGIKNLWDFGDIPFRSAFIWEGSLQNLTERLFWLFVVPALLWPVLVVLTLSMYFFRGIAIFYF